MDGSWPLWNMDILDDLWTAFSQKVWAKLIQCEVEKICD